MYSVNPGVVVMNAWKLWKSAVSETSREYDTAEATAANARANREFLEKVLAEL